TACDSPGEGYSMTAPDVTDCDDADADEFPGQLWYQGVDDDLDGFIGSIETVSACENPGGFLLEAPEVDDCNDNDDTIFPGSPALACDDPTACNYDEEALCGGPDNCIYGPVNDLPDGAIALGEGTTTIDNSAACFNSDLTVPGTGCDEIDGWCTFETDVDNDIFYTFTTPAGPAAINILLSGDGSGSLTDTQLAVFLDGAFVAANDDGNGVFSQLDFACGQLLPETTYLVLVDGYNGDSGTASLELTTDEVACEVLGCTDADACNFNPEANVEDGTCLELDCAGECGGSAIVNGCDECVTDISWIGCTDELACNYNPCALVQFSGEGDCDYTSCVGCTEPSACNFDADATQDSGLCVFATGDCEICEGGAVVQLSPDLNCDGICGDIEGCTYPNACNYDAELMANVDDGSCDYSCFGCNDPAAENFNALADTNEFCVYAIDVPSCEGDFNNDGFIGVGDLSTFLSIFGTDCD
ncbi:MAG: hypothetical protein AB8B53_12730, partial [Flavobacteriales bacterium]